MRTFLASVVAAFVIAACAALVLNTYVPNSSERVFATQSVRI